MLGAGKLNFISKFTSTAVAEIIRSKKGIQAVGNAQIDTAQSKFGGSSALFDGTGDYLQIAGSSDWYLGTAQTSWTIEGWAYFGTLPNAYKGIISSQTDAGYNGWGVYINNSNQLTWIPSASGGTVSASTAFTAATWQHWAVVRSGSSLKIFLGGTQVYSNAAYSNYTDQASTDPLQIGRAHNVSSGYNGYLEMSGWLDEIRISNTARYTANFTPSTTPFTNDDNTLLLLHMDGTDASTYFEDDNGQRAQRGVIAFGNAQVDTAQSKFGGSSALFDGNGDYLQTPNSSDFYLNTGNWTAECWFRVSSLQWTGLFGQYNDGGSPGTGWAFLISGNGQIYFQSQSSNYDIYVSLLSGNNVYSINTWNHAALVIENDVLNLYCNGNRVAQQNISGKRTLSNVTQAMKIGAVRGLQSGGFGTADAFLNGWMDEMRFSNTVRYTGSTYTVPTAPFVNDANTVLLLHMDGTDGSTVFRDDNGVRASKGVQAIGNAQIDTAQSKFGGSSALFDGTGDYLDFQPASFTDNFTYEFWIRFNAIPTSGQFQMLGSSTSQNNRYFAYTNNGGTLRFETGVTGTSGSFYQWWNNTLSTNTWYHVAFVKNSTALAVYVNGSALTSSGTSGSMTTDKHLFNDPVGRIGAWSNATNGVNGWIDEVRISNSARYTSNFTSPTAPFVNDSDTVLLLHMDGTDASTVFVDDNGVIPKTA